MKSDHSGASVTMAGAVVYVGGTKVSVLTRKQAYTKFLKDQCFNAGYQCGYVRLPRKLKKRLKRSAVRLSHYTKKHGVTRYNPLTRSFPAIGGIVGLSEGKQIPVTSGQTICFKRYDPVRHYDDY